MTPPVPSVISTIVVETLRECREALHELRARASADQEPLLAEATRNLMIAENAVMTAFGIARKES